MEIITNGWSRKCKDSLGGISKIWLFPYVKYNRSQIVTNGNVLVNFPETVIYEFYSNSLPNANESQEENEGGKFYNQSINLELAEVENIEKLLVKDFRLIFKDNNGLFRIFGLYNGLSSESLSYQAGAGKGDFNGFSLSFSGQEEKSSFFIDNLEDAGFIDSEITFRITEDGDFRITQNNEFRILE